MCVVFNRQMVLHKSAASVLKLCTTTAKEKAQHDEKWELGPIVVHGDWECIAYLCTSACFAVQLQTERHEAQNLLINISKVTSWLKDGKSNVSHSVCVFPVYLHAPLLFGF